MLRHVRVVAVVCPLSRIDTLITDDTAPPDALAMLRDAGVNVVTVPITKAQTADSAA